MSREAENALRDIVAICDKQKDLTRNELQIFDLALSGLGMVESQRKSILGNWQHGRLRSIRGHYKQNCAEGEARAKAARSEAA